MFAVVERSLTQAWRFFDNATVGTKLYTTPQQSQPLAYEQRRDIILQAVNVGHAIDLTEAAHGIKKGGASAQNDEMNAHLREQNTSLDAACAALEKENKRLEQALADLKAAMGGPVARVNDDGFVVETGLDIAPGVFLYAIEALAQPAGEAEPVYQVKQAIGASVWADASKDEFIEAVRHYLKRRILYTTPQQSQPLTDQQIEFLKFMDLLRVHHKTIEAWMLEQAGVEFIPLEQRKLAVAK